MSLMPSCSPPGAQYNLDKIIHFGAYFILTVIPLLSFVRRIAAFLSAGLIPVLGFFLEYGQKYVPTREFSPEDMIANNIGAIAGVFIGIMLRLNKRIIRQAGNDHEKNSLSLQCNILPFPIPSSSGRFNLPIPYIFRVIQSLRQEGYEVYPVSVDPGRGLAKMTPAEQREAEQTLVLKETSLLSGLLALCNVFFYSPWGLGRMIMAAAPLCFRGPKNPINGSWVSG